MSLDEDLRRALRRIDPPAGFVDGVLHRLSPSTVSVDAARRSQPKLKYRTVQWVAAAAALLIVVVGAWGRYETYRQRAVDSERLKRDVKIALTIASEKLNNVQQKVEQLNRRAF